IEDEVAKAREFNPRLSRFILATTAPRDAELQRRARQISDEERRRGGFSVTVFAWEDIEEALRSHPDLAQTHFPDFDWRDESAGTADTGGDEALDTYLRELLSRLLPVRMFAIGDSGSHRDDILLSEVYTALDTTAEVHLALEETTEEALLQGREASPLAGNSAYLERLRSRLRLEVQEKRVTAKDGVVRHRVTALEAAAAARRLVLTGPAGSGKSTFGRYLALSLAGQRLGRSEANLRKLNAACGPHPAEMAPWPHDAPLPVFVELRELVASETFGTSRDDAGRLFDFIVASGRDRAFAEPLRRALSSPDGALVVLDGLDEIAAGAGGQRQRLKDTITAFIRAWDGCRILVTSRPYAYQPGSAWRLEAEDFAEAALAEFDDGKIRTFVAGWYAHLAERGQVDRSRHAQLGDELGGEIVSTPYLRHLGKRPLMLTMMADLYAVSGGRLPGGRAPLYEKSVELLLDRWNQVRHGQKVSDCLGMPVAKIREALERLAFRVHKVRGAEAEGEVPAITRGELWSELDAVRREEDLRSIPIDEGGIMEYLHTRSGILLGESAEVYRFPHRSFQEYLAACHLTRDAGFPKQLKAEVEAQPELWREVVLLSAGRSAE
ncbi:MAG: NACHT domain-containing protein, partial [bacterium]|nr:NACHT domain-containing protein [bacterium]